MFDECSTRVEVTLEQSIDLTRLPSIQQSQISKKSVEKEERVPGVEYSSREVSPPALLLQQLLQAHSIFCLYHTPSLSDLFVRLGRDKFCNTLDRFWSRFSRTWDVLLHGNPAVDIFSSLKLASGGELGYGVGEEEWGSGERAVLEDLFRHTDGLVDVVVSRFGDATSAEGRTSDTEDDTAPWMGNGNEPTASDGVIFTGVGALERRSLADISLWMQRIYTYGDYAYGVRDNPLRERRKRRRRNPPEETTAPNGSVGEHRQQNDQANLQSSPDRTRETDMAAETRTGHTIRKERPIAMGETRMLSVDDARPNIPPPIVSAAENSLKKASQQSGHDKTSTVESADESGTTLGIPDQYMKYLTFGISTLGRSGSPRHSSISQKVPEADQRSLRPPSNHQHSKTKDQALYSGDEDDAPMLRHLDPMPEEGNQKSRIESQKQLERKGYFLIGLRGDLDDLDEEDAILSDASAANDSGGLRIVLRTVQVQTVPSKASKTDDEYKSPELSTADTDAPEHPMKNFRRLRVLIYVRQPFVFCFLFENRTSSLQYTKFYKVLHLNLAPIYKPLLASTDPEKAAERIESSRNAASESETASISSANRSPSKPTASNPIYHLVHDPRLLTVSTTIPNIPEPGTPAAEGIITALTGAGDTSMRTSWTRIEAMNVHSQILNTLASVKGQKSETERTSKTNRGWWVVWVKVDPSVEEQEQEQIAAPKPIALNTETSDLSNKFGDGPAATMPKEQIDLHRIAFLIRKASDGTMSPKPSSTGSRAMSSMLSNMSFGLAGKEEDETGGANAGFGPVALAGGIGVDARNYVEGLLTSLSK